MSAVVPIREGVRIARKNRADDQEAISFRRLIGTFERIAFADNRKETLDERANALAFTWGMARKLPCSKLRLLAGTKDERRDFEVRLSDLELARAEREVQDARRRRLLRLGDSEAAEGMRDEAERLWERHWQAAVDLANSPVFTVSDLRRKKAGLGTWLRATGERYEVLRAGVAADEARLAERKAGRR
jgi:hypothetical protein